MEQTGRPFICTRRADGLYHQYIEPTERMCFRDDEHDEHACDFGSGYAVWERSADGNVSSCVAKLRTLDEAVAMLARNAPDA